MKGLRGAGVALMLVGLAGGTAAASVFDNYDSVEDLVAYLNSPEGKQATGLKSAERDGQFTNRLNVVFESDASLDDRHRVLQDVGREFLAILFRSPGISTVTIIEKNAAGKILNRSVTNVAGFPGAPSGAQQAPGSPMGAGD